MLPYLRLSGLLAIPILLVGLPPSFFDTGQSLCLSVLILHKECMACGLTRAIQHLIHFEFQQAWQFNKLVVLVFPILSFVWARWVWSAWKGLKKQEAN
ncbi:MAG: hypothetical protein RLZZ65_599 [Bacteroidota bacterium]|jgi:hypothetical protein